MIVPITEIIFKTDFDRFTFTTNLDWCGDPEDFYYGPRISGLSIGGHINPVLKSPSVYIGTKEYYKRNKVFSLLLQTCNILSVSDYYITMRDGRRVDFERSGTTLVCAGGSGVFYGTTVNGVIWTAEWKENKVLEITISSQDQGKRVSTYYDNGPFSWTEFLRQFLSYDGYGRKTDPTRIAIIYGMIMKGVIEDERMIDIFQRRDYAYPF